MKRLKKKIPILIIAPLVAVLFTQCTEIKILTVGRDPNCWPSNDLYAITVNSWGNYELTGKTFYVTSGDEYISENDLEFVEFKTYLEELLMLSGARPVTSESEKKAADLCVFLSYGITDKSYDETVPKPVWGETGVASIQATTTTIGSTTNTNVNVKHNHGITGHVYVNEHREKYLRYIYIHAFDNKKTESPLMLWKTNIVSEGSNGDIRQVFPHMFYNTRHKIGINGVWNGIEYEDDYMIKLWKDRFFSNREVTLEPYFSGSSKDGNFQIAFVVRNPNETVVCIRKIGYINYKFSQEIFIDHGDGPIKISRIDGYEFGKTIRTESGWAYYLLRFPCGIPSNINSFNLIEYANKKHTRTNKNMVFYDILLKKCENNSNITMEVKKPINRIQCILDSNGWPK